jgi:hypothetical protein
MSQPNPIGPTEARRALLELIDIVHELVATRGDAGMSSGELYGLLMGVCDINSYQQVIDGMVGAGVITNSGHLLKSTGRWAARKA